MVTYQNGNILESITTIYTHHNFGGSTSSILEFGIILSRLYEEFSKFEVLEEDDMTSDHLPFRIEFRLNSINQNSRKKYNILKANWSEFQSFFPKVMDPELIDIDEHESQHEKQKKTKRMA